MENIPKEVNVDFKDKLKDCSDTIIRFVVSLAMAANDLIICHKRIQSSNSDDEMNYLFRQSISHLREVAKFIKGAKENDEVKILLESVHADVYKHWESLLKNISTFEDDSLSRSVLKPIRDITFHYPDINGEYYPELPKVFRALDKVEVKFVKGGSTLVDQLYLFAECTRGFLVNAKLSKKIVRILSFVTVDLAVIVDGVLEHLHNNKRE